VVPPTAVRGDILPAIKPKTTKRELKRADVSLRARKKKEKYGY